MTELPRKTSVIAFVLLDVAYCISYVDRAAISLALAQIGKDFSRPQISASSSARSSSVTPRCRCRGDGSPTVLDRNMW
ncbi:hypothetical protein ACVWXM_008842 [Bradyrhizobium sp. GM7.3]